MKKYIKRFEELSEQLCKLEQTKQIKDRFTPNIRRQPYEAVDSELLDEWKINVKSLLANACGNDSEQYKAFNEVTPGLNHYHDGFDTLKKYRAAFNSAKKNYLGGYCASAKSLIEAEVFTSQIEQAQELLDAGYYVAAAVIAGVVLETKLRELCTDNGIDTGKLNKMNDDLTKAGVYNSLVQKQIASLSAIRNSAAHGKTNEFNAEQVKTMIQEIVNLLAITLN